MERTYRANPVRQMVKTAMTGLLPPSVFVTRLSGSAVALTFDDGPHPEHTPPLLDLLADLKVAATFFVVGARAAEQPELVRRMVAEGHEVGHHTYSHFSPQETSVWQLVAEVRRTDRLLRELTGQRARRFRPPLGKVTPAQLVALWGMAQTIVLWNSDPRDYDCTGPEPIHDFFAAHPLGGGEIVLLHEQHRHTAAALPELIEAARSRGLHFTTVGGWLRR